MVQWEEITAHPSWHKLSPSNQKMIRNEWFQATVAPLMRKEGIREVIIEQERVAATEKFDNAQGHLSSFMFSTVRGAVDIIAVPLESVGRGTGAYSLENFGASIKARSDETFGVNLSMEKTNSAGHLCGILGLLVLIASLVFPRRARSIFRKLFSALGRWMPAKRNAGGASPSGIGGWLAWFCLGLILFGPFATLTNFAAEWKNLGKIFPSEYEPWVVIRMVVYGFASVCGILVGIKLWKLDPNGRGKALEFLSYRAGAMIVFNILLWAAVNNASDGVGRFLRDKAAAGIFSEAGFFIVWGLYFKRSRRVRNTFGPIPAQVPNHGEEGITKKLVDAPPEAGSELSEAVPLISNASPMGGMEEELVGYKLLADEIAVGVRLEPLWLMACAEANGDTAVATAWYNRKRAAMLRQEMMDGRSSPTDSPRGRSGAEDGNEALR